MSQLKTQDKPEDLSRKGKQEDDIAQTTMKVDAQSSGVFENFYHILSTRTNQIMLNIFGNFSYTPKNKFTYQQKTKILDYLQSKVFTKHAQLQEQQKIRFTDFDQHILDNLPEDLEALRSRLIKAKTNLDAAQKSIERYERQRQFITIRYINEQAYEFDKTKHQSVAWGLLLASFINCTIYKQGIFIRKAALFVTLGHLFGGISYMINLDRYFDSVYPIFEKDAVKFSKQEKEEFKGWKPQGNIQIED